MSDRLTRKEIKRDEFAEAIETSVHWVEEHRNLLIAAAVAVVVVVAGAFGVATWLDSRAEAANRALADALEAIRAPVGDVAATAAEDELSFPDEASRRARAKELFTSLRDEHGGSEAAAVADVYLAQIAIEEGDAGRARELWEGFLEREPDHLLASQVRVNLIHLDRQEGNGEELVAELEGELAATLEERTLPADLVLWELAQTYEALGRQDEARSNYQRLAEEYPTSPYAGEARRKAPPEGPGLGAPVSPRGGAIPIG